MEEVSATADRAERERAGNGNNQRHVFDIGADTLTDLFPRKPRALNGTTNIKKSFFQQTASLNSMEFFSYRISNRPSILYKNESELFLDIVHNWEGGQLQY